MSCYVPRKVKLRLLASPSPVPPRWSLASFATAARAANWPAVISPPSLASVRRKERWPSWDPNGGDLPCTILPRCRLPPPTCRLRGCGGGARPWRSWQCPPRRCSCRTPHLSSRPSPCRRSVNPPNTRCTANGPDGFHGQCGRSRPMPLALYHIHVRRDDRVLLVRCVGFSLKRRG